MSVFSFLCLCLLLWSIPLWSSSSVLDASSLLSSLSCGGLWWRFWDGYCSKITIHLCSPSLRRSLLSLGRHSYGLAISIYAHNGHDFSHGSDDNVRDIGHGRIHISMKNNMSQISGKKKKMHFTILFKKLTTCGEWCLSLRIRSKVLFLISLLLDTYVTRFLSLCLCVLSLLVNSLPMFRLSMG